MALKFTVLAAVSALLLALTLSPFNASASAEFGHSWPEIVDELQALGITQVGDLDLEGLKQEAHTARIRWKTMSGRPPSHVAGPRADAYFDLHTKTIYVEARMAKRPPRELARLELHEVLGVLGMNDHNYQITNALEALISTKDNSQRDDLLRIYERSNFTKPQMIRVAGGSSVGGGGDSASVSLKNLVLDRILKLVPDLRSNAGFRAAYPKVAFEPLSDLKSQRVVIEFRSRVVSGSGRIQGDTSQTIPGVVAEDGFQELITVYFPMRLWETGGPKREKMINDIAVKLVNVFKANPQKAKRGLLREKNVVGYSEMTDSLPDEAVPLAPGKYYYNCSYRYRNANMKGRISSNEGRPSLTGLGWSLSSGETLNGMLSVSGEGEILGIALIAGRRASQQDSIVKTQPSRTSHRAKIDLPIHGQTLSFGCARIP